LNERRVVEITLGINIVDAPTISLLPDKVKQTGNCCYEKIIILQKTIFVELHIGLYIWDLQVELVEVKSESLE
jgi:hypothetical protein